MPELKPQISFLSEEEAGIEPIIKEEVPASTAPVEKNENVESPESKKEKEKKDTEDKALLEKTKPAKEEIPLLTEEEAEAGGVEGQEDKKTGKKLSQKDIDNAIDYKALVQAKIDTGAWEKWQNWDEIKDKTEFTPELYLELEQEQFEAKVNAKLAEEKQSLPKRIQEITDFIKNGGKEEDLYATYQQEFDVESLNPEEIEDAETLVRAHCEATGWSDEKTNDYIDGLKDRGEEKLKKAGAESKEALSTVIQEERQEAIENQQRIAEQNRIYAENFNKRLKETIYKRTDIPDREKKAKEKFLFNYDKVDADSGLKTSDFGIKWKEIVRDPVKYEKFVDFVQNFEKFEDKSKTEAKVITSTHNFLRGSQIELGKNNSQTPEFQEQNKKGNPFNLFNIK